MFGKAKKILASELMYAKDMDEEKADEYLDDLLEKIAVGRAEKAAADAAAGIVPEVQEEVEA
jgi:hypothetical protein